MTRFDDVYFGLLGLVVAATGGVAVILGVVGDSRTVALLAVEGTYLLWRGPIVFFAGTFFLRAAVDGLDDRRAQGVAFLAGLMLWIVAATDVLARVLGAIPGGGDVWVASAPAILGSLGPPYAPAILFGVLALPVVRYTQYAPEAPEGGDAG
ncbi:MAG: hypothetical protein ACQEQY_09755 [Halobacteriota archaeon]